MVLLAMSKYKVLIVAVLLIGGEFMIVLVMVLCWLWVAWRFYELIDRGLIEL